jgi:hypothetical protein
VHSNASFDYAVIRVVPRVEREEFVNAGVLLFSRERRYLGCRVGLDADRLMALWPDVDVEAVSQHLRAVYAICVGSAEGGPIAALSQSERFGWLTAPRSTILQTSPVRTGVCSRQGAGCEDLSTRLGEIAAGALSGRATVSLSGWSSR